MEEKRVSRGKADTDFFANRSRTTSDPAAGGLLKVKKRPRAYQGYARGASRAPGLQRELYFKAHRYLDVPRQRLRLPEEVGTGEPGRRSGDVHTQGCRRQGGSERVSDSPVGTAALTARCHGLKEPQGPRWLRGSCCGGSCHRDPPTGFLTLLPSIMKWSESNHR